MSSLSRRAGDRPPRMSRRRIEAVAAALVPGLLLAACSGGDGTAEPSTTSTITGPPPAPTLTPPRGSTTTVPTQPLRVTGKMTRPGTRLRFGQKAIVPVRDYNALRKSYTDGVLGIVVRRIRHAPGSRVEGAFDPAGWAVLKRSTAYSAEIVMTNESGNPMQLPVPRFEARRSGGGPANVLLSGGTLPGCEETHSPDAFDHEDARWVTCEFWVSAYPLREIHYMNPPYGQNAQHPSDRAPSFERYYDLGPIIWH
ncbi:hypothetical protein GCM10027176_52740 [Actinoallomurus bryophytorum]|uniref:Uncharacterized protein n=1 Tax=Actinoallomurus bryophytorum TaxID=1490222 RepID=A0A543CHC5_9ACTN|nr:hypothetical protein [Actinoallomurus bryophytorum]TQL96496.1 hypothetical protein FB559_2028 [Actinoallomurus bryophytorum]